MSLLVGESELNKVIARPGCSRTVQFQIDISWADTAIQQMYLAENSKNKPKFVTSRTNPFSALA